jgi:hypothetical protein
MNQGLLFRWVGLGKGVLLFASGLMVSADTLPAHQGTRLLKCGKLVVEVDDPSATKHHLLNREAWRFSPVAMVLNVQFNG